MSKNREHLATRWLIRIDMPDVMAIDEKCFLWESWNEEDWLIVLRQNNVIPLVVDYGSNNICGVLIYELHRRHIKILRLAVAPEHQGRGVGTFLIDHLILKLSPESKRQRVVIDVSERDLDVQLWLSKQGFTGKLLRRWEGDDGDGIRFEWCVPEVERIDQCHTLPHTARGL